MTYMDDLLEARKRLNEIAMHRLAQGTLKIREVNKEFDDLIQKAQEKGLTEERLIVELLMEQCGDDKGSIDNMCISTYEEACKYLHKKGVIKKLNDRMYKLDMKYFSVGAEGEDNALKSFGSSIGAKSTTGKRRESAAEIDSHEGCSATARKSSRENPVIKGLAKAALIREAKASLALDKGRMQTFDESDIAKSSRDEEFKRRIDVCVCGHEIESWDGEYWSHKGNTTGDMCFEVPCECDNARPKQGGKGR